MQGCSSQRELFMAVLAAMGHNSSVKFKVSAEGFKYLPSLKSFWQRLFKRLASSIKPLWFLQVSFKTPVVLFSSLLWLQHTACYYHSWHEEGGGAKVDAAWCDSCFPGATDTPLKWIESVCLGQLGDMTWTSSHKYRERGKVCVEPRCSMKSVSANLRFAYIFVWYCGFQKPFCSKTHTRELLLI